MSQSNIKPNTLAFIGLSNEYCVAVENARESERDDFVASMTRLLPRIYISASDLDADNQADSYIDEALDEDYYDSVRRNIETLLGEDDSYLEVFEEDMKYSETPIAASIAESLADIFQVLYNFLETVRDAPEDLINDAVTVVAEDFRHYWSRTLCNVLRALNAVRYQHD
mgnify:CR=1 FL=1